jgi:DNA-binding NarL/FixJ family response regulator
VQNDGRPPGHSAGEVLVPAQEGDCGLPGPVAGYRLASDAVRLLLEEAASGLADDSYALLSPRERQVLRLIALGHTNQQVAGMLGLSVKTVETYKSRLMTKLGLTGRAALVRYALQHGLLDEPE